MKKIKATKGYTIYEATEKDESKYNVTAGYFYLYFSSDIRDYGLSCSEWDWEAGSLEEATAWANSGNYAAAREIVEAETTCATYEQIAAVEARLDAQEEEEEDLEAQSARVYEATLPFAEAISQANVEAGQDNRTPYERVIARDPDNKNAWRLPGYPGPLWRLEWNNSRTSYYPTLRELQDDLEALPKSGGYNFKAAHRAGPDCEWEEIPAETRQQQTDRENRETCRRIAEEVEAYASGQYYRCPECGELIQFDDLDELEHDTTDGGTCYVLPCGCETTDEPEQMSLYDFFADCYDIEYRCGSDREYRSVSIMVACGGPNIYINTAEKAVLLYWWTDRARYYLTGDAVDAVDAWAAEYWEVI